MRILYLATLTSAQLLECHDEYCCPDQRALAVIGSIRSAFHCYAESSANATFHLFDPTHPFDKLATGSSASVLLENAKTDEYLHRFTARLKTGNYTFQVQQGSGRIQQREIYFDSELDLGIEIIDDTSNKGYFNLAVRAHSMATRVFYENHVKSGHSRLELIFKTNPELRKRIAQPKRRRRSSSEDELGVMKLTPDEMSRLESAAVNNEVGFYHEVTMSIPGQRQSVSVANSGMFRIYTPGPGPNGSFNDFWAFLKKNWILVTAATTGLVFVVTVAIVGAVCWRRRSRQDESTEQYRYDYNPAAKRTNQ